LGPDLIKELSSAQIVPNEREKVGSMRRDNWRVLVAMSAQ
jgi:hypothetical protein